MPLKPPAFYYDKCKKTLKHSCPGIVLGVRMAVLGCDRVGLDPTTRIGKNNLLVFVEIDRCITDAVSVVTGCRLGKRTMKFYDYGIAAATFLNLKTNEAVRILANDSARQLAESYVPQADSDSERQRQAYKIMADEELFIVRDRLKVHVDFYDLPGSTKKRVASDSCGVMVNDNRQVVLNKNVYCQPCHIGGYWKPDHDMFVPEI